MAISIMKNHLSTMFFGIKNRDQFFGGMQAAIGALHPSGIFTGDNLFTFNRNLSFLTDEQLVKATEAHITSEDIERAIMWRTHVAVWAAQNGLRREGDFAECGCYKGYTARVICDYVDFNSLDKSFYLYDLFEHDEGMNHHAMEEHSSELFDKVKARFTDFPKVHVIQGAVPESFSQGAPEKISFLHIDMNNADAEVGALEQLFDRVVDGAVILFDDYGWLGYREQKVAEDAFMAARGYQIVELPTGQGMVIK